ncbi:hypothetical protein BK667_20510 [Pseudomonas frederiksbergensis]|nr:hypothetical protein BK667_20510 [Pseudomonas frederiksbergensis]
MGTISTVTGRTARLLVLGVNLGGGEGWGLMDYDELRGGMIKDCGGGAALWRPRVATLHRPSKE